MKNLCLGGLYFGLSALLTWLFVVACPLYISKEQMLLSSLIAGAKWSLQIVLALLFLKDKSFIFLKKIGFVCLSGSLILIPYIIAAKFLSLNDGRFFFYSLVAAVSLMIFMYHNAVKQMQLSLKWWFVWLSCLAIAVTLQLTVVFHFF